MKSNIFLLLFFIVAAVQAQDTIIQPGKKGFGVAIVQKEPVFPGGEDSLQAFLKRNIMYPKDAKINRLQGRVFIGFMVDKSGKIVNPAILSSASPQLDEEALRVVKLMPDWLPGTAGGMPMNVQYILPIDFIAPGLEEK